MTNLTDQELIQQAKAERAKGNMISCYHLTTQVKEKTAELYRLQANTLIDLDCPYKAHEVMYKLKALPISQQSDIDYFKNLDVKARIHYKSANYERAIELIKLKITLSENKSRELPFLLWISTVSKNIDIAVDTVKEMLNDRSYLELSEYELKSLTLYDKLFNLNKYKEDELLIEMCLNKLGKCCVKSVNVDNGPWCFILANIGYHDKRYIKYKFYEQNYIFECSIIDAVIPTDFIQIRRSLTSKEDSLFYDNQRELLYMSSHNHDEARLNGLFPL